MRLISLQLIVPMAAQVPAPMSLLDNVGMPIHESLPMVIDSIANAGLRSRIKVIASGKLINPAEVAWALLCWC